ncbi:hypothetical protein NDU88_007278 [Pleurodeles waltl]|uniref:Uncharacterized protein n=1 Tax=Pleurodeles waltl TaxID=8319 RepID=A0AAV7VP89_PLEWA|nr:hypothetical protein NDU88_007278 [Pleurodeles waltl]
MLYAVAPRLENPQAGRSYPDIEPTKASCSTKFKSAVPRLGGACTHSTWYHGRPSAGSHYGPHPTGNLGGGSQAEGDGQRHGLPDGGDKIFSLGQSRLSVASTGTGQRVSTVEMHITSFTDRDQELLYLLSKLIDLEDRSRRNNIRFLGFLETIEGADIHSYLRETLPKLTGLTFDPSLEFQRVHRLGPKRRDDANRPRPIIACLLRHVQTSQLLQTARSHCLLRMGGLEIRLTADFSKETSESRRAFLTLRPSLPKLEVKYGLFELARIWITKNEVSKDIYDPEDLRSFLVGLQIQTQSMDIASPVRSQDLPWGTQGDDPRSLPSEKWDGSPQTPNLGGET